MEVYQFNAEQLESLVSKVNEACQDKSLSAAVQLQLDMKSGKHTTDNNQFKQNIIDLYNANPSCITRILDMTKNVGLIFFSVCINLTILFFFIETSFNFGYTSYVFSIRFSLRSCISKIDSFGIMASRKDERYNG